MGVPDRDAKAVLAINRRRLLETSAVLLLLSSRATRAAIIRGGLPWTPGAADPPAAVVPDGWKYFTPQEAATVEAFVDRLIPADDLSPGGKDCGCAVYIDRQLAGPHGRFEGYYMSGPFQEGTKQQGQQSSVTPAQHYRKALAALDAACRGRYGNK
ncbi:MAG: gluconate 2-dehydrogenase subunit 3 family protein, partial [Xanthobacteraceae bacterium]